MSFSIHDLKDKLQNLFQSAEQALRSAQSSLELYNLKTRYMGSRSAFQKVIKEMKNLSPQEKPLFGKLLNEKKKALEDIYSTLFQKLKEKEWEEKMESEKIDLSLPGPAPHKGGVHPVQLIIQKTVEIFKCLGI